VEKRPIIFMFSFLIKGVVNITVEQKADFGFA
jgi:hypothetical protein